eukprot:COSAG02_NODE_254_length_26937_cov_16.503950_13_plen_72_part_00
MRSVTKESSHPAGSFTPLVAPWSCLDVSRYGTALFSKHVPVQSGQPGCMNVHAAHLMSQHGRPAPPRAIRS